MKGKNNNKMSSNNVQQEKSSEMNKSLNGKNITDTIEFEETDNELKKPLQIKENTVPKKISGGLLDNHPVSNKYYKF